MTAIDVVPLLRAPSGWPAPVVATLAMAALAGLDLVGSVAAKEWVETRSTTLLVAGVAAFLALFWVYASSLQYAELSVVTFGWVALLQVSLVLVDRFRYEVEMPPGTWVAIVVMLGAQAYLILAPALSS